MCVAINFILCYLDDVWNVMHNSDGISCVREQITLKQYFRCYNILRYRIKSCLSYSDNYEDFLYFIEFMLNSHVCKIIQICRRFFLSIASFLNNHTGFD